MSNIPENLKYTKDHEWAKLDGDVVTVGLTDYAQSELGDIVFVEMPEVGDTIEANEEFGTIEAVKTVAPMLSPVSGEVIEINEALEDASETINSDPYGEGWIVKIKVNDPTELENLLDADTYAKLLEE